MRRLGGHWHLTWGGGPRGQHTPCFLEAVLDGPCLPMGQGGQPELQELPAGKWETQVALQLGQRRLWGLKVGRVLFWQPDPFIPVCHALPGTLWPLTWMQA